MDPVSAGAATVVRTETASGVLDGHRDRDVISFRGIPFAKAPVGALRLRPPERPDPWTGVRPATAFGAVASQDPGSYALGYVPGLELRAPISEDCLYLNVWTTGTGGPRRPVMVWIHGGGFQAGAGSQPLYDGAHLAEHDVVAVSINYRLGVLGGFFNLGAHDSRLAESANVGILDQVAALEWVRENIAAFGGDPGNVTIFGNSAGSASVSVQLTSSRTNGLVHRAICQSGVLSQPFDEGEAAAAAGVVLDELGLQPAEAHRIVDIPWGDIVAAQLRTLGRGGAYPFLPWRDGTVVAQEPRRAAAEGVGADIPLLLGTTRAEYKMLRPLDPGAETLDEAGLLGRLEIVPGTDGGRPWYGPAIERYREVRTRRGEPATPADLYYAIESDRPISLPARRFAETRCQAGSSSTYVYLFEWTSPNPLLGSCHQLEIPFVFGTLGIEGMESFAGAPAETQRLAREMQEAWIAFARTGSPSSSAVPWAPYDLGSRPTMIFGAGEPRIHDDPQQDERRIWDSVECSTRLHSVPYAE